MDLTHLLKIVFSDKMSKSFSTVFLVLTFVSAVLQLPAATACCSRTFVDLKLDSCVKLPDILYSYDNATDECQEFHRSGCKVHRHHFAKKEDCERRCLKVNVLPMIRNIRCTLNNKCEGQR
ncbi:Uncharacterised protein g5314 [Pycnogonum litorale]